MGITVTVRGIRLLATIPSSARLLEHSCANRHDTRRIFVGGEGKKERGEIKFDRVIKITLTHNENVLFRHIIFTGYKSLTRQHARYGNACHPGQSVSSRNFVLTETTFEEGRRSDANTGIVDFREKSSRSRLTLPRRRLGRSLRKVVSQTIMTTESSMDIWRTCLGSVLQIARACPSKKHEL
ncbi:hypothetical protein V1478_008346 [Vespula squamosa]|uniref:Uncharacterized protein n=1 Tax=Vespula squamosa TaxID=30214 RepID=A0ABD2AYI4_VESSQ